MTPRGVYSGVVNSTSRFVYVQSLVIWFITERYLLPRPHPSYQRRMGSIGRLSTLTHLPISSLSTGPLETSSKHTTCIDHPTTFCRNLTRHDRCPLPQRWEPLSIVPTTQTHDFDTDSSKERIHPAPPLDTILALTEPHPGVQPRVARCPTPARRHILHIHANYTRSLG